MAVGMSEKEGVSAGEMDSLNCCPDGDVSTSTSHDISTAKGQLRCGHIHQEGIIKFSTHYLCQKDR